MWPRVNQMSRTLLFHSQFWQIRYQLKVNTPSQTNRVIFGSSIFEVKQIFLGEAKVFWASLVIIHYTDGTHPQIAIYRR